MRMSKVLLMLLAVAETSGLVIGQPHFQAGGAPEVGRGPAIPAMTVRDLVNGIEQRSSISVVIPARSAAAAMNQG